MLAILEFFHFILNGIISFLLFALFVNAALSWLMVFGVLNHRSAFVYNVQRFLDSVCEPLVQPVRKILPSFGTLDLSYLATMLLLSGVQQYLLPAAFNGVYRVLTGSY